MHDQKNFRIQIIIPIATDAYNEELRDWVAVVCPADLTVDVTNLDQGTQAIQNRTDLATNAPYVIAKVRAAERLGYDGVLVSDFDMCGVEPSREQVAIPVVGGFRAQAFTAMALAQKFSVLTILESVIAMQTEHFYAFGILDNFASIRSLGIPVAELTNREKVVEAAVKIGIECIDNDGAEALIFGCTGFIGVAPAVSQRLCEHYRRYIPVTDPNRIALLYLYALIRNGLRQSGLAYAPAGD
ncbi:MAG: aspartate/glutamate racemase family protein [Methylomicrobium sp.]